MKPKKLLTFIALVMIVFFAGCKKDDYIETVGLCPLVVSTDPVNLATGVPLNKVITATFNQAMNPATITQASFTVGTGAKAMAAVTGVVTYSGMVATFTPATALAPNTTYTGTLKKAIKDLKGNSLQEDYTWTFSTGAIPTVVLADPLSLSTNVSLNKVVRATFSEAMDPLTITSTTFTLMNGVTPVAGAVTYTGLVASFTPTVNLLPGTNYTATVTTGARNVSGIPMAGNFVWTFNTGAVPSVTSTSPLDNATGVLFNKVVTAVFSEAMDPLTIIGANVTLMNGATPVAGAVTYTGNTMSFTPSANLLPGTLYTATITTGAKNAAGISIAANKVWTFTTATVPTVITADPLHLATNVPINKVVRATFSELMNPLTITGTSFTLMNGVTPVAGAVTYAGSIASFTPTVDLLEGTLYTATVTTSATNVAGVPMAGNFVWTFTTVPPGAFTLNITALNGTVAKSPSQPSYNNGDNVQLTATANAGYTFASWSGDASGSVNPLTVLMDANKNITANFTANPPVGPGPVILGSAANFAAIGKTGISTTGTTLITGDIGVSPVTQTGLTGFSQIMDASGEFSRSSYVVGKIYASDYAVPTPAYMTTAISDMENALTTAMGMVTSPIVDLGAGNISGMTLAPGLYKYNTGLLITNVGVTLSGGPNDTWVFQVADDFTVNNSAIITLSGGAQAKNIFWVTSKQALIGSTVNFKGNIIAQTLISINTGTTVLGRLLSQTAVTLNAATVIKP